MLAPQPFFEERGTPIAVRWAAETLAAGGHAVDLLTFHCGADVAIPGVRHLRAWGPRRWTTLPISFSLRKLACDVFLAWRAGGLARRGGYDVIHAVEEAVFPALWLRRRARARLVYDMDSSMAEQLQEKWAWLRPAGVLLEWFERRACRGADLVLPVCERLAVKARRLAPGACVTVLADMAMEDTPGPAPAEDLRSMLGARGLLALYVGNLEHYQGIDLLLEALRQVPPDTGLTLAIIGGRPADMAACQARADALGLADRVRFLGPRPVGHLQHYLRQADVLVSPRRKGLNTPMKIYSYLLAGRAILATRIPSHEQVLDDTCACLCAPDPAALAAGFKQLLQDPDRRLLWGRNAAARARLKHGRSAYRETLLGAYAGLRRAACGNHEPA